MIPVMMETLGHPAVEEAEAEIEEQGIALREWLKEQLRGAEFTIPRYSRAAARAERLLQVADEMDELGETEIATSVGVRAFITVSEAKLPRISDELNARGLEAGKKLNAAKRLAAREALGVLREKVENASDEIPYEVRESLREFIKVEEQRLDAADASAEAAALNLDDFNRQFGPGFSGPNLGSDH